MLGNSCFYQNTFYLKNTILLSCISTLFKTTFLEIILFCNEIWILIRQQFDCSNSWKSLSNTNHNTSFPFITMSSTKNWFVTFLSSYFEVWIRRFSQYYNWSGTIEMSVDSLNVVKNEGEEPKLSTKRETDWMKVLFQIQINLSALGAIHFLFRSYWCTIFYGE